MTPQNPMVGRNNENSSSMWEFIGDVYMLTIAEKKGLLDDFKLRITRYYEAPTTDREEWLWVREEKYLVDLIEKDLKNEEV